jgi:hypothetical protein
MWQKRRMKPQSTHISQLQCVATFTDILFTKACRVAKAGFKGWRNKLHLLIKGAKITLQSMWDQGRKELEPSQWRDPLQITESL